MRSFVAGIFWLWCGSAFAVINSPSAVEVSFSYQAEFITTQTTNATELALQHAQYLTGYLQNTSQVDEFKLNSEMEGIGAPQFPPEHLAILSDTRTGSLRHLHYQIASRMLLAKEVATRLLTSGKWTITLPYDMDHFFIKKCGDWEVEMAIDFWYSYDPFQRGCQRLRQPPLAHPTTVTIEPLSPAPILDSKLSELRGEGERPFQVATIDGYDDDEPTASDTGRMHYLQTNAWFRAQGFHETLLTHTRAYEIRRFEKIAHRHDGREIPIRVDRFLGQVNTEQPDSAAFSRFFIQAVASSDVIIYLGHSGFGRNLQIAQLEEKAKQKMQFNPNRQLFYFDACSSYSYYLPVFASQKPPGSLDLISSGLESIIEKDSAQAIAFYQQLFDVDLANPTWNEVLTQVEKTYNGASPLLNIDRNVASATNLATGAN